MSRRTFFPKGVIHVHNHAPDGELAAALTRIAEALSNLPTVVTINNPEGVDPAKAATEAVHYVEARLLPEERRLGAPTSIKFRFTARELKRVLVILPGLKMLRPKLDLLALVTEAKQILSDAAAAGDE